MILGYILPAAALLATIGAVLFFILSEFGQRAPRVRIARACVVTAAMAVVGTSAYLVYLFWTHQFQVEYIASYSAKTSAARYLFAAFWGGQEGSILLWLFWTSILGVALAFRGGGREGKVWPIYAVVQTFLIVLVLIKSPFALGDGPVPTDGKGLNPLLENYWMVIHPPILFLGFASLAVPFAWAIYGLVYRDWDGWIRHAFSWALFCFALLGFGTALGGYWAYETLGWGGFWAWDPVENTSLVPWLAITGLLHGIAIQRANGGFKVANFVMGILPLAWMSWGTFLTRTGLLSDFSVHSFGALDNRAYTALLIWVLFCFSIGLILLAVRYRSIPRPAAYERVASREFGFFLAATLLGIIGLITAIGMSAPILTKTIGRASLALVGEKTPAAIAAWAEKGAAAQPEFYNQANFPLVILLLVAMAIAPYLSWRKADTESAMRRLLPVYAGSILLTFVLFGVGRLFDIHIGPWMLLLFAAGAFAVLANVGPAIPRMKRRESRRTVGGFIAHAGAALLLVGVACLVSFSKQERVVLIKGRPTAALGYQLTYQGMASHPFDRSNGLKIKVEKDGRSWEAKPHMFIAPFGGRDQLFANPPAIHRYAWGDLYIAHFKGPVSQDVRSPNSGMQVKAMETRKMGEYTFKFWGLDFNDEARAAMKGPGGVEEVNKLPEIRVKALVDVTYRGETVSVAPEMVMDRTGTYSKPAHIPGAPNAILSLDQPQFPQGAILSTTNAPDATELVYIDISTKPLIWLVWVGTLLYTLGGLIAYRRRAAEMARGDAATEDVPEPAADPVMRPRPQGKPSGPMPEPARAQARFPGR